MWTDGPNRNNEFTIVSATVPSSPLYLAFLLYPAFLLYLQLFAMNQVAASPGNSSSILSTYIPKHSPSAPFLRDLTSLIRITLVLFSRKWPVFKEVSPSKIIFWILGLMMSLFLCFSIPWKACLPAYSILFLVRRYFSQYAFLMCTRYSSHHKVSTTPVHVTVPVTIYNEQEIVKHVFHHSFMDKKASISYVNGASYI